MKYIKGMILLTWLLATTVHAQVDLQAIQSAAKTEPVYNEYYTITEKDLLEEFQSVDLTPVSLFQSVRTIVLSLLQWTLHNTTRPTPEENYIRKLHFGRWINDPTDDTCMNTRAKILVRDSDADVTYRSNKRCVVDTGKWLDPYSNREFLNAREIQIDHMVPLKHAYLAGAWKWDYKTRCLYANYMGYRNHLLPASVRENTSKGDRAPDKYLPSNLMYRCQYVKDWLTIKLIWRLNMTADEVQAIHEVVTNYNCNMDEFTLSKEDLAEQRQHINSNLEYCMINKR
ncbi:MAG: DUF1524 domain-containing protein [Bdellovibrio sp.]